MRSLTMLLATAAVMAAGPAIVAQTANPVTTRPQINLSTPAFPFAANQPKLVVLVHGITPSPEQDKEVPIAKLGHTRYYWGGQFIKSLQGEGDQDEMFTLVPRRDGTFRMIHETSLWEYNDKAGKSTPHDPLALAPIQYPKPLLSARPTDFRTNQAYLKEFINFNGRPGRGKSAMVMTTYRNGSKHLMPQVADTIDQVYDSYMAVWGKMPVERQPQLYFVGHSFGGIIARAILNAPTGADLFGNKLTAEQVMRAKFLRDRMVSVVTLGTPHEGTPIVDMAGDLAKEIRGASNVMAQAAADYTRAPLAGKLVTMYRDKVLDAIAGERNCLKDIQRMDEYNRGILDPSLHKRSDNSFVPIYTACGRQPGGLYFDRDRNLIPFPSVNDQPFDIHDVMANGDRAGFEAGAQYLINGLMHIKGYGKQAKRPWGSAPVADYDRKFSAFAGEGADRARPLNAPFGLTSGNVLDLLGMAVESLPYREGPDGENDSDGFVGMESGHAHNLKGGLFLRLADSAKYGTNLPWDWDNHGSECFNPGTGAYLFNHIVRDSGPRASSADRFGRWSMADPSAPAKTYSVTISPTQLVILKGGADTFKDELSIEIEIAGRKKVFHCPEGESYSKIPAFTVNGLTSSVVPVKVTVWERDNPPVDRDDNCVVSPVKSRDNLILFVDVEQGTVLGDVKMAALGQQTVVTGTGNESVVRLALVVNAKG